jgi:hypothetical protein
MKIQKLATSEKTKLETENVTGLRLAVIKRTTVQVTRQTL